MNTKLFEVRDAGTFIPVLAVKLESEGEAERYLLARTGYGLSHEEQGRYVLLLRLAGGTGQFNCDPYGWGGVARTMLIAHEYIIEKWDELESGAVVDVEYICGLTGEAKRSEREEEVRGDVVIPVGDVVICDWCGEDYTKSEAEGGLLFQSRAVCPGCAPKVEEGSRECGEDKFITMRALTGERFGDFVRRIRGPDAAIRITTL